MPQLRQPCKNQKYYLKIKENMYDLEVLIPICTINNKYKTRAEFFKKYGLFNIDDKKIIIKALHGPNDDIQEFDKNWPENIIVKMIKMPVDDAAQKIYSYYYKFIKTEIEESRWFIRVDDDSVTDVSGLLNNLDEYFDHTKEHYLVTELRNDVNDIDKNLIKFMGYEKWYDHTVPLHELECGIVSQATMKSVINTPKSMKFFHYRHAINGGWGDHGFALAAKFAKIYPINAFFLNANNDLDIVHSSLFDGHLNHVHLIAPDKNNILCEIITNKLNNNNKFNDRFSDNCFTFSQTSNEDTSTHMVILKENGTIQQFGNSLHRVGIWQFNEIGELLIAWAQHSPLSVMKTQKYIIDSSNSYTYEAFDHTKKFTYKLNLHE